LKKQNYQKKNLSLVLQISKLKFSNKAINVFLYNIHYR
jgi:hypothetical protein